MPETPFPLKPDPFAEELRALAPAATTISRDRLLFEAGQAAAAPRSHWVWPSSAAFFAGLSIVLSIFVLFPERQETTIRERERLVAAPNTTPNPDRPSPPPINEVKHINSDESGPSPEQIRMFQVRRDVLRWGPEMLPAARQVGGSPSRDSERDIDRWLDVPPGTFTAPYQAAPRLLPKILGDN
jgi:hypothetical protein